MIFAGIDVNIISHEKALAAGVEAMGLWMWGMCYAQLHTTDGRLPRVAVLSAIGGRRNIVYAKRLVDVGLWLIREDGDWDIWNYAAKNQTTEDIAEKRKSWKERAKRYRQKKAELEHHALFTRDEGVTSRVNHEIQLQLQTQRPLQIQTPLPNKYIGPELAPAPEPVKGRRRKPETPCPESSASVAEVELWASRWEIPAEHAEFENFLDYHRKKDTRWRDWSAAWRYWLKNGQRFNRPSGTYVARGAEITKQPMPKDATWANITVD